MSHSLPAMDLNLQAPLNPVLFGVKLDLAANPLLNSSHCSHSRCVANGLPLTPSELYSFVDIRYSQAFMT